MIKIKNKNFVEAVKNHPLSKDKLVAFADSSQGTLDKIMSGNTTLQLSAVHRLAEYLGFDVVVSFEKKPVQAAQA